MAKLIPGRVAHGGVTFYETGKIEIGKEKGIASIHCGGRRDLRYSLKDLVFVLVIFPKGLLCSPRGA